jgi:hypothetical protein
MTYINHYGGPFVEVFRFIAERITLKCNVEQALALSPSKVPPWSIPFVPFFRVIGFRSYDHGLAWDGNVAVSVWSWLS